MCHKFHWLYFFIPSIFLASAQDQKIYRPDFCYNDRYKDSRLNTTLFMTTHVSGQMDCLIECDKEPCCRSINFKKKSSSQDDQNCEMLHNVVNNTSEKLLETNVSFDHIYFTSPKKEYDASCLMPKDIDECSDLDSNPCDSNAECINTNGSRNCTCKIGFTGTGKDCSEESCTDSADNINECDEEVHQCHSGASCINTIGSYICDPAFIAIGCSPGFIYDGSDCKAISDLQIRLSGSSNNRSGRVEIYIPNFGWGTVCDDNWEINNGNVVCRQLGFTGANTTWGAAYYGEGSGPILLDDVQCNGEESYIWDCPHLGWNKHNCGHNEDAGVECY